MIFQSKLYAAIQNHVPFVLFRKPEEKLVWLMVQDGSELNNFVFHSFDSKVEKTISDAHPVSIFWDEFNFEFNLELDNSNPFPAKSQSEYEQLIQTTIEKIQNSRVQKVVISRIKIIENKGFNIFKSFRNLVENHPNGLVYLWFNSGEEVWMGATPELLLSQTGDRIQTVSLAGTKLPESEWTEKEFEEQKLVTDYILENFSDLKNLNLRGSETVNAGKFQHLKSYISGDLPEKLKIEEILKSMHPTPAVCGLPKVEAFDFIQKNEGYDRSFYTGFIGLETEDSREYFVNLRCAELFSNQIKIYIGGGITADSNPEREWAETELKAGTIEGALEG